MRYSVIMFGSWNEVREGNTMRQGMQMVGEQIKKGREWWMREVGWEGGNGLKWTIRAL